MKKRILSLLLFEVLLLGIASPAHASVEEWNTLNEEFQSLYREGKYDRALAVAKKILEIAEKESGPEHHNVASSLNNLAVLF